jgi:hypothetical protein
MWWLGLSLLALGEVCLPQARLTRSLVHAFAARFLAYVNTRTHWHSCIDSIRSCSGRKFSRVCVRACDARLATWRCLGDGERCVRALPAPRAPVFIECATTSPVALKLIATSRECRRRKTAASTCFGAQRMCPWSSHAHTLANAHRTHARTLIGLALQRHSPPPSGPTHRAVCTSVVRDPSLVESVLQDIPDVRRWQAVDWQ